jgi:hypothetical protein
MIIHEQLIRKDVEGRGRGLKEVVSLVGLRKILKNLSGNPVPQKNISA